MRSIYRRQFALMAGMILVSFLLLGTAFIALSYQYIIQDRRGGLERNADNIATYTRQILLTGRNVDDSLYQAYVNSVAEIADAYVIVCDPEGVIAYSVDGTTTMTAEFSRSILNRKLPAAVVQQLVETGEYNGMTSLGDIFPDQRYVSGVPVTVSTLSGEQISGMVLVAAQTANVTELWRAFITIFFFTSIVVMCIAFVATSVTSLSQTKPLKEMAEAARKFGMGEFDTRVEVGPRKDEVGELAEAFNNMADALAKAEARRSEFVANISHELKTPMTTIAGFSDGILDGTIPPERETEALQTISNETRRLSRLVRRMLDLSRLQATENVTAQEQFDISELLVRVLLSLETKITGRGLDVEIHLPDGAVKVWGDPDGITQVCYNLLDNAIKFAREGSVITLSITTKGPRAYISVRNEGETISPEELPLLFDRFHKSDKSRSVDREGVGLGLYIVKTILNNHRESITVKSENGVTEFTFTLLLA